MQIQTGEVSVQGTFAHAEVNAGRTSMSLVVYQGRHDSCFVLRFLKLSVQLLFCHVVVFKTLYVYTIHYVHSIYLECLTKMLFEVFAVGL